MKLHLKRSQVLGLAIALYIAFVLAVSFRSGLSLTPDRLVLLIALAALGTGKVRLFLKDWSLFLVVLLAWQALSSMSRNLGHLKPHVTEMITVDRTLFFGHVPTVWLQHHFYSPHHIHWYDVIATLLYMMHFAFPMLVAFALWYWRRPAFMEFMVAFVILAFAGFATYVLFPAVPPWLAAKWHYLPHIYKIFAAGATYIGGTQSYSLFYHWIWQHGGWDEVAAMPSEHAAFPFLCFLYARQVWKRAGWLLLPYCCAVWVAVVYLGEHYVADVIAGVLYASVTFVVVHYVLAPRWRRDERADQIDAVADTVPA